MHHGTHHLAERMKDGPSRFDRLMLIIGIGVAFMTLPQIITVWQYGAAGVSIFSWAAYLFHSLCWLTYGVVHRERIIISVNAVWVVMNSLVVAGILLAR